MEDNTKNEEDVIKDEEQEQAPPAPKQTPKEDKEITVNASQLKALLDQNEALMKKITEVEENRASTEETIEMLKSRVSELGRDALPFAEEVKNKTLRLQMWNDMPIVGLVNKSVNKKKVQYVFKEVDPVLPTKINDMVEVLVLGETDPVKMLYSDFIEADSATFDIVSTEKRPVETIQGSVNKTDYDDWSSRDAGYKVNVKVITEDIYHTVKGEDGKEFTVHETIINVK